MQKDLEVFKNIRIQANSGLYKYRTEKEIDSIYQWASQQTEKVASYRDFFNLLCVLTDFEGSLHNDTALPKKMQLELMEETQGYFPYPIKWIEGKWIVNYETDDIPLGSEILSVNGTAISEIIKSLGIYYTTDGKNLSGKTIGLQRHFSRYYRLWFGARKNFTLTYTVPHEDSILEKTIKSVGYKTYYKNVRTRFSKPFDKGFYKDWNENNSYTFTTIGKNTGLLTVNSFSLGNAESDEHKRYVQFLDSIFTNMKRDDTKNLIVDVRNNGGGTDPNDLVTYSYMTDRDFRENRQAWISFGKIPLLRYVYSKVPKFLRPLGVGKYNKMFQKEFPNKEGNKYFQSAASSDKMIRNPRDNAFTGTIYLLISPRIASAGSLFAAMLAGNDNTIVIGEETMGGYYGHNGHNPLGYTLPKSRISVFFSVVNLEQDVPVKENQQYGRGIIPHHNVSQTYEDYLTHTDTQMNYVLKLIKNQQISK
ncbi:MAG: S41 family peptidase [Flavobacteriaceae bacterium]